MSELTSDMHDSELIERAQQGDRDAFAQLYRTYHPPVMRMAAFYLQGAAEDAVAETFVRAWQAIPRYRDTGAPFSSWLYSIARHVIYDELRKGKRSEPRSDLPEGTVEGPDESEVALAEALKKLPKEQRQVLEMKYLLGMSNAEVGAVLDRSPGAVNALQWRALRAMRTDMESV